MPDWTTILSRDPRWVRDQWDDVADIESVFGDVGLEVEALAFFDWMQNGKGKRRAKLKRSWIAWLRKAKRDLKGRPMLARAGVDPLEKYRVEAAKGDRVWQASR